MASKPDLSEFLQANGGKPRSCGVAQLIESLDGDRAAALVAALDSSHIQHAAIGKVLKSWGFDAPTDFTIGRHRRGQCCCG